ncbi:glycosyl transferase [Amycolatopsis palatopharyngis]|uniref:glycosyl transferase n=1 Tax=Amycolatopsis palatopharyngis TaxID=187982 RepID=UPI003CCC7A31
MSQTTAGSVVSARRPDRERSSLRASRPVDPVIRGRLADVLVLLGSLLAAFLVFRPLWLDPARTYLAASAQDQNMWEWFFAVSADAISSWSNPLFTDLQNFPLGVNLMSNTVMLGMGIPLAPVTLLFGSSVTWALVLTGGLAGTAFAWYWVLSRYVVASWIAAAIGGLFAGFAPPIISHANAHPNFTALFVLPLILGCILRLAKGIRPVRTGLWLGLLGTWQVFLGEEPLLIAAVAFVVFAAVYALSRPELVEDMARPLLKGAAVAAAVCLPLVAFPLWWQFAGPQSYGSLEHGPVGNDLAAFTAFATESAAGNADSARELSINRTEENAFFGWPLVLLMIVVTVWLWRDAVARAVAVSMWLLAWISTGVLLTVDGTVTSVPGPWLGMFRLPLLESVLESRFALACVPLIGILLALATQRVLRWRPRLPEWRIPLRVIWFSALLTALLPIVPTELRATQRPAVPEFFAEGTWREYVDPGGSVVIAPLPDPGNAEALHWQVRSGLEFPLAEGYFVGPGRNPERGTYGAISRDTSDLLADVADSGELPEIGEQERAEALRDLRYWRADVIVLAQLRHRDQLRTSIDLLLERPGRLVDGVWFWDVRDLTGSAR